MAGTTKLAWRNLGRNRRRTLITASALILGTALCVATYGLMDGMLLSMLRALTRYDLGHLQAHQTQYLERRTIDLTLPSAAEVERRLRADPGVLAVAPRVYGFALASHDRKSRGVQLVGLDPRREPRVTELHQRVVRGHFLAHEPTPWPRGKTLSAQERAEDQALTKRSEKKILDELDGLESLDSSAAKAGKAGAVASDGSPKLPATSQPIAASQPAAGDLLSRTRALARKLEPPPQRPPLVVVGAKLAKQLRIDLGQRFFLVGQTVDGASAEVEVKVRGVLSTGTDLYDRRVYFHLADLQRYLHLDHRIHELAARVSDVKAARPLAARLRAAGLPAGVVVQSWGEIRVDVRQMIEISQASSLLMILIILFVAVLGVVNTMLMSVFERTREIGVLKAIGMSSGRVLGMIVAETLLLALVAAALGTALGLALDGYLIYVGIDLTGLTSTSMAGIGIDPVLRGAITAQGLLAPAISLIIACLLASLYPAIRAARLRPAIGMREL